MKLKNGLRVLWRSPKEIQIGTDPRLAHTIEILHPREFETLKLLETEQTPARLRRVHARAGGVRERVDQLLAELRDHNLLASTNLTAETQVPPAARPTLAAEAETRSLIEPDGWKTLAQRAGQSVTVYGLGRTGAHVALALAASGVGTLQIHDPRAVRQRDLGQVYDRYHVRMPRAEAVAQIVSQHYPSCQIRAHQRFTRPDAAVLIGEEVTDPTRAAYLTQRRINHLAITIEDISITVGPYVVRQAPPCLRCQRLWATEQDPSWPALATQRFTCSAIHARGEDPTLAAIAGNLAAAQVLQALAGQSPAAHAKAATISLPDYIPQWHAIEAHPRCHNHQPRQPEPAPTRPATPPPPLPLPPV
ncbi:MAG: ThiF family adenylyltransferase [Bifidobacteriaceae bacterium]|jgi:hypothetical protein|nr:ThiF family adenylyltransferase [Bifidobacteriaceae bacterium]